jgi:hypothetical protein
VPLVEIDPTPHPTTADFLDPQAGDPEKLAAFSAAGPRTFFRHNPSFGP